MAEENMQSSHPELTDTKVRPDKIWKAIALIVVSGLVFGGIGYFYGKANPNETTSQEAAISNDTAIVGENASATTSVGSSTAIVTTPSLNVSATPATAEETVQIF